MHAEEIVELSPKSVSFETAVEALKASRRDRGLDVPSNGHLPGVNLTRYVIHDIHEPVFQRAAEPYIIGVAIDSELKPFVIPWGLANIDPKTFQLEKAEADKPITFGDDTGAALVLPPVHDFLSLVLLVADSDAAPATIAILEGAATFAKNSVVQSTIGGVAPGAAVALAVLGPALDAASAAVKANRDDVIALYSSSYFTADNLVPGRTHMLKKPGATVYLKVGVAPEAG